MSNVTLPGMTTGASCEPNILKGAPVPVKAPPYPQMKWPLKAPAIAGFPGYTEGLTAKIVSFQRFPFGATPLKRIFGICLAPLLVVFASKCTQ
jgi:hypothetical protein